jgi:hypothetical protein
MFGAQRAAKAMLLVSRVEAPRTSQEKRIRMRGTWKAGAEIVTRRWHDDEVL